MSAYIIRLEDGGYLNNRYASRTKGLLNEALLFPVLKKARGNQFEGDSIVPVEIFVPSTAIIRKFK